MPPQRVIGCVVYPASELVAPGVVRHIEGDRFPLGELDGSVSERAQALSDAFVRAGFKAPVLDNIRAEIWLKLWGNLVFNPVSALTRATLEGIARFEPTRELAASMMAEAQTVANKLGITFRVTIDKRIAGAEKVGAHKTSMLQDVEAGREPEVEALVGSVVELARLTRDPHAAHRCGVRTHPAVGAFGRRSDLNRGAATSPDTRSCAVRRRPAVVPSRLDEALQVVAAGASRAGTSPCCCRARSSGRAVRIGTGGQPRVRFEVGAELRRSRPARPCRC